VLDLALRLRVHALEAQLRGLALPGIIDITPGVRSLQVHYDSRFLPREALLAALQSAEQAIPPDLDIAVPSRIVHLPLSWDDPQTRLAAEKYMQSVRPDAPWCPDNIEFIRRINGLASKDDVLATVFDASYLVLGLGDVYLGAPVATPVDPRHRLVTTKYNPARTWTPENAVGIGGAYLCIYGMEGPGGYQLFGRTTQVWNTWKSTRDFAPGTPWLLRPFDQIRFYPVSAAELLEMRDGFPHGDWPLQIEAAEFRYHDYLAFLESIQDEVQVCRARQQEAFGAERARWAAMGPTALPEAVEDIENNLAAEAGIPEGCEAVASPMTSSVWKILVEPGQRVNAGDSLLVLEAMKTETVLTAPRAGVVEEIRTRPDALVMHGQNLLILRTD
jgi:urea carboxylase